MTTKVLSTLAYNHLAAARIDIALAKSNAKTQKQRDQCEKIDTALEDAINYTKPLRGKGRYPRRDVWGYTY